MIPRIDLDTLRFAAPIYLWLLVVPAALLLLWGWRVYRRRTDIGRLRRQRTLPVRERYALLGDLTFWLCGLIAGVAVHRRAGAAAGAGVVGAQGQRRYRRPAGRVRLDACHRRAAGSLAALGSVPADVRRGAQLAGRPRRAGAVRANRRAAGAADQAIPNALFFFIDHLGDQSPFRLESAPSWDTNIEEGIRWGLRLVEKDRELFGDSGNPKAFVVISDGQSWSGTVANALAAAARGRHPGLRRRRRHGDRRHDSRADGPRRQAAAAGRSARRSIASR